VKLVGRNYEKEELKRFFNSGKPEFVVIYGRRRVGKTFLVREMFKQDMAFYFTGAIGEKVTNRSQLSNFDEAIAKHGGTREKASNNWHEAFGKLRSLIEASEKERKVIFIDEMPWLDYQGSDFLSALDYFWNGFASSRADVMLVACGSATSWIIKNLFESRGGLHNRITGRLRLSPFTLGETEALFDELGIVMNRYQIVESYMVFGGIPYYLNMFVKGFGPSQNVDRLLFSKDAPLKDEFQNLYKSLFSSAERHMAIVVALSETQSGKTRDEIIKATGIPGGGNFTRNLNELEQCGFIEKYTDFTKPKNGAYYRLTDNFSLFWLKFVNGNNTKDEFYWTNRADDGAVRAWHGFAFEQVCMQHIVQIKQKLGISGISTEVSSWRSREAVSGAQIDLLIDRKDGVINLCEAKFSLHPITVDKALDEALQRKKMVFKGETETRKALHITMVTTYGLTENGYRGAVQSEVTMEDLFRFQ
jgi:AAA+ ATPase superfamily predicted ATPase